MIMKRLLITISLMIAGWLPCSAQTPPKPLNVSAALTAAGSSCVSSPTANSCAVLVIYPAGQFSTGGISITLAGTFVATIQFEGSADGVNVKPLACTPLGPSGTAVSSATAPNVWQCPTTGLNLVDARVSAYTSGTINSFIQAGGYPPAGSSSGGGANTNATIVSPLDGSGYVETDCKTGCAAANPNGQATMANSSPVVLPSNQSAIPVNNNDGAGNALTSNSTTQSRSMDINLVSVLGATHSKTNPLFSNLSDGANSMTAALSAWGTPPTGTEVVGINANVLVLPAIPAGSNTIGKFDLLGNSGVALDAAPGATAPSNSLFVAGVYNSANVTPSTGQTEPLQQDSQGDLETLVRPISNCGTCSLSSAVENGITTSVNVKASAGSLYGFVFINGASSVCYVSFQNSAGSGTLGTANLVSVPLPTSTAGTPTTVIFSSPIQFSTGIAVGISTTAGGATACGTAGSGNVFYK